MQCSNAREECELPWGRTKQPAADGPQGRAPCVGEITADIKDDRLLSLGAEVRTNKLFKLFKKKRRGEKGPPTGPRGSLRGGQSVTSHCDANSIEPISKCVAEHQNTDFCCMLCHAQPCPQNTHINNSGLSIF